MRQLFGSVDLGQPIGIDNESIDADLARVVFNCASTPELHQIVDPARLGWKPIVKIEHYHVGPKEILNAATNPGKIL